MAIRTINIGNVANDGTGDDLREAFLKVNQNFEELYARVPESTTASNSLPDEPNRKGIFSEKVGYELKFKNLVAGTDIELSSTTNTVTINSVAATPIIISESGSVDIGNYGSVLNITSEGPEELTTIVDNVLTLKTRIGNDPSPELQNNLNANGHDIINAGDIYGTFKGLIGTVDLENYQNNFDFGAIGTSQIGNVFDLLLLVTDADFGNFAYDQFNLDLGTFSS